MSTVYRRKKIEIKSPLPLFDSLEFIEKNITYKHNIINKDDFKKARGFLKSYNGSIVTFNSAST